MKTAQEWLDSLHRHQNNTSKEEDISLIEQIQLDAYRAGMLCAADYLKNNYVSRLHLTAYHLNELSLNEAILETIKTDSTKLPLEFL